MNPCWSEGDLRALLDRELPAAQALAAEQHLAECAKCAATWQTLSERAALVTSLMGALSEEIPAAAGPRSSAPVHPAVWVGAALALAAGLVLALVLPSRPGPPPVQAVVEAPSAPATQQPDVEPAPAAITAPAVRPRRTSARAARPTSAEYYMALDEEPIDTGLVMRVALPSGMQADVIVDGEGRARAIRPIQTSMKEER